LPRDAADRAAPAARALNQRFKAARRGARQRS
jgi:hypothetical protein